MENLNIKALEVQVGEISKPICVFPAMDVGSFDRTILAAFALDRDTTQLEYKIEVIAPVTNETVWSPIVAETILLLGNSDNTDVPKIYVDIKTVRNNTGTKRGRSQVHKSKVSWLKLVGCCLSVGER